MGFGSFGNLNKMMKQAQKMQQEMMKLQEELKERTVEASAGGGAVKVTVTGSQELVSISIAPEVVDPDDVEMLQDLVLAAVNEGLNKAREMAKSEMAKITGGVTLPGF
ncbi:MAG TPA: YbaB/EbfC family nucleoid-associated protein [Syntrophothermus lipocalidus]|uniref:Nucleoid-associated protein Slip_0035 n=1 Tax=Syntrophothermus lipocalidus (strain DSM 12680 / TGB-C1) TaxID=643648 RepID=D7CIH7_SYNLT|nr:MULTISPECIES: YbaB/EbfC family nucleoid-associated protein [Syntrophothermus]ADI00842.1 conserved hypothetical protein [Syntrophothermus lipocalidus DSM 12680]NSW83496.1 YbaB/EbfC family nucleoid-associated protein [Syntrophothermus sp.]HHV76559.1 YbaB/EbfC family nucleoid-associated protein [Syntrophothermus lipocalidus]